MNSEILTPAELYQPSYGNKIQKFHYLTINLSFHQNIGRASLTEMKLKFQISQKPFNDKNELENTLDFGISTKIN